MTTPTKVTIYRGKDGFWYWHLKALNGRIVADSGQGYHTKWGCKRAARKFLGL